MAELHQDDPPGRFTGLAEGYAQYRPDYPEAALDFIIRRADLGPGAVVADIGAGTGISARLFARRGFQVLGIEPNDEMRARAEAEPLPPGLPRPSYRPGRAEATGLPAGSADLVLAAQAFHWFDPAAALAEFHRILRPGGWAALLWNERDERDPLTADFGTVMRTAPEAARVEGPRRRAGMVLGQSPLFEAFGKAVFAHRQVLDREGLLGRALSISYAPRQPAAAAVFTAALDAVFERHQRDGRVTLHYETTVYLARRRS